jgi:hypothetical protein
MPDEKNDDFEVPHVPVGENRLVKTDNYQQDKIPIFWGPNQITSGGTYSEPSGFRGEILRIPRVGRFLHASKDVYNTEDYAHDDGGGGGGDPDDYYIITSIGDHIPPFPHDFVIYYNRIGTALPGGTFFSTSQYVADPTTGELVNVGALLSVGMKWITFGAAFNWIWAGVDGPGWYPNSGIPLARINFF